MPEPSSEGGFGNLGFEEWISSWRDGQAVGMVAKLEGRRHRNACMGAGLG